MEFSKKRIRQEEKALELIYERIFEIGKIDAVFELGLREEFLKSKDYTVRTKYKEGFNLGTKELALFNKRESNNKGKIKRNLNTEEGREYWEKIKITAKEFLILPEWKRK